MLGTKADPLTMYIHSGIRMSKILSSIHSKSLTQNTEAEFKQNYWSVTSSVLHRELLGIYNEKMLLEIHKLNKEIYQWVSNSM